MADQLRGLLLGELHGPLGLPESDRDVGQPGVRGPELLAVCVALLAHPVQLAGPAVLFGLAGTGAFADLPQHIGGESAEQVETGLQPVASPPRDSRSSSRSCTRWRRAESSSVGGSGARGVQLRTIRTSSTVAW